MTGRSDPLRRVAENLAETWSSRERSPRTARQRTYHELATSDDPLLREIGEQLHDGTIRPYQMLAIPGYEAVVVRGLDRLKEADAALGTQETQLQLVRLADEQLHREERPRA